ncbi:MAG: hypothetical protein ACRCXA_07480, partial [Peptostreptococcaceae bacterium]
MKRKIISSLGASVLVFNVLLSTPIFADEYGQTLEIEIEIENEERYTYIDKTSTNLKISGGIATISASMTANRGVSKTLITSRLQKKLMVHGRQYNHGQNQVILFLVKLIRLNQF